MIKIREDGHDWTLEEHMYMPDINGKLGIDVLKEHGVEWIPRHPVAPADFGVCKNGAQVHGVPRSQSVLMSWEPPGNMQHLENESIRAQHKNYLSCVVSPLDPHHFTFPRGYNLINLLFNTHREHLVCLISRNRTTLPGFEAQDQYELRRQIVATLTRRLTPEQFHVYGRWPASPYYKGEIGPCYNDLAGFGLAESCPVTKGIPQVLDGKYTTLPKYHYNICVENSRWPGYMTEKFFQAAMAGCIPVYMGPTEVDRLVPPDCYIDMRGKSIDEVADLMLNQTPADRVAIRMRLYRWLTEGDGAWWFSSVRMAHKLLWAFGIRKEPVR